MSKTLGFKRSAAGLAVLVAAATAIAGIGSHRSDDTSNRTTVSAETLAVTDLADDRKLVGLADSVFFGTVIAWSGQAEDDESQLPETQFSVSVDQVIKGSLSGTVTVNQQGGVRAGRKDTVALDGDQPLGVGKTYLFVTRTRPETHWHTLVPRYGDIEVRNPQQRNGLRNRFMHALEAEIPYRP